MVNVEEIKGIKGLYGFKAMQTLLLSYYLLPEFKKKNQSYQDFLKEFSAMDETQKRDILNKALYFAGIDPKEIEALMCFCKDKNGISYSKANINNLTFEEIFEIIIEVCLEISKLKVFF